MRLGLLSPQKKIAVINNYTNIEETENFLLNRGAFNLKSFLDVQKVNLNKTVEATFKTSANSNQLNRAIYTRLKNAEEKEINELYPNDKDVPVKARFYNENQVEDSSENDEYFYNPEDEFTSLVSDVAKSEMDKSRLILPDSKTFESSLNEFVPATKLRGLTDYISESEYYKYYRVLLHLLKTI